jgi:hypothetical protein
MEMSGAQVYSEVTQEEMWWPKHPARWPTRVRVLIRQQQRAAATA